MFRNIAWQSWGPVTISCMNKLYDITLNTHCYLKKRCVKINMICRSYFPCCAIFLYKILSALYKWPVKAFSCYQTISRRKAKNVVFVAVMNFTLHGDILDISAPYDLPLTHGWQSLTPRYGAEAAGYEARIQVNRTAGHFRTITVAKYWQEIARRIRGRRSLIDQWLFHFHPTPQVTDPAGLILTNCHILMVSHQRKVSVCFTDCSGHWLGLGQLG